MKDVSRCQNTNQCQWVLRAVFCFLRHDQIINKVPSKGFVVHLFLPQEVVKGPKPIWVSLSSSRFLIPFFLCLLIPVLGPPPFCLHHLFPHDLSSSLPSPSPPSPSSESATIASLLESEGPSNEDVFATLFAEELGLLLEVRTTWHRMA